MDDFNQNEQVSVAGYQPNRFYQKGDIIPIVGGGTGLSALGTANQVVGMNNAATGFEYKTFVAGTGIQITHGANSITITNTGDTTSAALTSVSDTNVTLTLGGTPASALLQAVSITVGWSGTLAPSRGGVGFDASTVAKGGLLVGSGAGSFAILAASTDGFVLTLDSAQTNGIKWAAAAGGGVTSKIGSFTPAAGTGSKSVTGVGFQPTLVLFFCEIASSSRGSGHSVGYARSSTERGCMYGDVDTNGNAGDGGITTSQVLNVRTRGGSASATTQYAADFVSMDADGFTLNFTTNTQGGTINYIAMK